MSGICCLGPQLLVAKRTVSIGPLVEEIQACIYLYIWIYTRILMPSSKNVVSPEPSGVRQIRKYSVVEIIMLFRTVYSEKVYGYVGVENGGFENRIETSD